MKRDSRCVMWSFASLGDLMTNFCITLGPSWVVACWCAEEVWWRKTFSEGWGCQIVSQIIYYYYTTPTQICILIFSYRLCELLYDKKRNFAKVLSCYVRDKTRRVIKIYILHPWTWCHACPSELSCPHMQPQAFAYIHSVMNEDHYTEPDREEVTRAVLQNIQVQ